MSISMSSEVKPLGIRITNLGMAAVWAIRIAKAQNYPLTDEQYEGLAPSYLVSVAELKRAVIGLGMERIGRVKK